MKRVASSEISTKWPIYQRMQTHNYKYIFKKKYFLYLLCVYKYSREGAFVNFEDEGWKGKTSVCFINLTMPLRYLFCFSLLCLFKRQPKRCLGGGRKQNKACMLPQKRASWSEPLNFSHFFGNLLIQCTLHTASLATNSILILSEQPKDATTIQRLDIHVVLRPLLYKLHCPSSNVSKN